MHPEASDGPSEPDRFPGADDGTVEETVEPRRPGARGIPNRGPAAAEENRRALVRSAREVFSRRGLGAPLTAVARGAGVGQGSLYRHFPDRLSLAFAIVSDDISELEEHVAAGGDIPGLLERVTAQTVENREVADLVSRHRDDPRTREIGRRFRDLVARLILREREAGRVRADRDVEDVALIAGMMMAELLRESHLSPEETRRRLLVIFVDSLVPEPAASTAD